MPVGRVTKRLVDAIKPGDHDPAIADYTKAIEIDPKCAIAYYNRCWLHALANSDLPLALSDCDTASRLAPNAAEFIDSCGFVYLRLNRLDEASTSNTSPCFDG